MEPVASAARAVETRASAENHTRSLVIVTMLFFMWGLLTSLNDVLIPHLKAVYTLTYVQAMLVQFCFFGAYFIVSLPAGHLIKRIGYQNGAVAGLVIAAAGCALFYPAAQAGYGLFLAGFFVLASGITILQVAANPYVTVLGPAKTASSRLTLTQAFNSLGTTVGPLFGGILILAADAEFGRELHLVDPAAGFELAREDLLAQPLGDFLVQGAGRQRSGVGVGLDFGHGEIVVVGQRAAARNSVSEFIIMHSDSSPRCDRGRRRHPEKPGDACVRVSHVSVR